MRTPRIRGLTLLLLAMLIGGCGGGGGSGNNTPPPPAPAISYGATTFSITVQTAVTLKPTNSGGAVASWSIGSGLPAGLSFNASTGAISGTIAAPLAPSSVTVTAKNAGGSDSVTLTIGVQSALLTLGATNLGSIAMSGSRVLTEDAPYGPQHWVLWDYASGTIVAQGDGCPADSTIPSGFPNPSCGSESVAVQNVTLAGSIAVVPYTYGAIQVLSASDGSVLSTIKGDFFKLQAAPDASYVCTVGNKALTAWATNGSAIASHAGNYSGPASVSCAVGEMRVANGPAGASVIERVALPSGQTTVTTPFAGAFSGWFADGSAFLTSVGNTLWVYSPTGTQLDTKTFPTGATFGGVGQWFWISDGTNVSIYNIGASTTPKAVYPGAVLAASAQFLVMWDTAVHLIDLSGATPVKTDYPTTPVSPGNLQFAAVSAQQWVVGTYDGAVLDGTTLANAAPRFFGYGSILALAGSPSSLAVATASGQTLIYDTSNWSLVKTLRQGLFKKLQVSADGSTLAILGAQTFGSSASPPVQTISLPSGTVINTWAIGAADIALSSSGLLLGQVIPASGHVAPARQVTAVNGGPVLWSDSGTDSPIYLSSDDTLIAVNAGATNIYLNDKLSTQLPGTAIGWLANDNILQNVNGNNIVYSAATGAPVGGVSPPAVTGPIQVVTADSIYDRPTNAIYSLTNGSKTWSGAANTAGGVVAGSRVAYMVGNQLVTEPY